MGIAGGAGCDGDGAGVTETESLAELGRIAMHFVDRAGDYCDQDPAEAICDEFYRAMAGEVERQRLSKPIPEMDFSTFAEAQR